METKELRAKLNSILDAIAAGRTCEQILAADQTLSYHDIFHAVAEAPTSYWEKASTKQARAGLEEGLQAIPRLVRHRTD
ncbi:MAG TPA: hypothetical protein P5205_07025 [Candidatus Paceibacterota bacterium]|nr:hypothetical protein [Verrucomicrobiota bacterium]HSA10110.1 hypothetical protein [Candidatus Paceibacterota bacterium]